MSDISETSVWLKFFTEAGIPPSDATGYAITFTDNRIKQDMLPDLNKEYLKDMGITVLGDIIAILKHARSVTKNLTRERAFPTSGMQSKTSSKSSSSKKSAPEAASAPSASNKKNAAATRMLEHYVRKEQPTPPPASSSTSLSLSPSLSARLSGSMKRQLEEEDNDRSSKKNSVFDRLGGDNDVSSTTTDVPKITVTILGKKRLEERAESPVKAAPELSATKAKGSLQYHGVLKYSKKELEKRQLSLQSKLAHSRRLSEAVKTARADSTVGVKSRLGKSARPNTQSEGIFARQISDLIDQRKNTLRSDEDLKIIRKTVRVNKRTGQFITKQNVTPGIFRGIP